VRLAPIPRLTRTPKERGWSVPPEPEVAEPSRSDRAVRGIFVALVAGLLVGWVAALLTLIGCAPPQAFAPAALPDLATAFCCAADAGCTRPDAPACCAAKVATAADPALCVVPPTAANVCTVVHLRSGATWACCEGGGPVLQPGDGGCP